MSLYRGETPDGTAWLDDDDMPLAMWDQANAIRDVAVEEFTAIARIEAPLGI